MAFPMKLAYAYNSMMKLGSITDQTGSKDTFTYDGEGNLTCHVDRNGHRVNSKYGSFGILLSETAEDGTFHTRKYDTQGRLVKNASNHVVYRYDYNGTGRLKTKYVNGKAALTYTYTAGGKVASIKDISGLIRILMVNLDMREEHLMKRRVSKKKVKNVPVNKF